MSSDIWDSRSIIVFTHLDGTLFRSVLVDREVSATGRLISTLEEHAVLEKLLEESKPSLPTETSRLHYLLRTPFRYPPLSHGSRFGKCHEASLFYGSLSIETVLFESAYYRFVFWQGMTVPPNDKIRADHTLFSAYYACHNGIKLHQPPFDAWQAELTDRCSYTATQALGSAMRSAGVNAFEFTSARDPSSGLNVALFTTSAFVNSSPNMYQSWTSETTADGVVFFCHDDLSIRYFNLATFLVDSILPMPAV
jgi:hypothetical protein